ncbi:MAG: PilZ domain-containing protein [Acidobacteria bacterium]|nr:PilZ domain-containing protein [Acidobacteriota bacterium]MCA1641997.1 PilZ domain-containing protein [Acidobacteriota bacterium]
MGGERKDRRVKDRLRLALPVRVLCREGAKEEWTEQTRLVDLTPFGASFSLARPVEPGRLVHLTMPMPRQLRCFDHIEDQYRVYAIVRWIRPTPQDAARPFLFGVAFTGKRPPQSYLENPTTRYEIEAEGGSDLWRARERGEKSRAIVERETRLTLPVEVVVEVLGESGETVASETTVTENISRHGASVFSTLQIEPGKFVRLRSARYSLAVLAVVRGSRKGADNIPRLHLEFVDRVWPLEILQ